MTSALAPDWERQEGRKGGEAFGTAAPPGSHMCRAGEAGTVGSPGWGNQHECCVFSFFHLGKCFGVGCSVGSVSWGARRQLSSGVEEKQTERGSKRTSGGTSVQVS